MKANLLYVIKRVLPLFIGLIILTALVYSFYLLSASADYFGNQTKDIAQRCSLQATESVQNEIQSSFAKVNKVVSEVSAVSGFEQMDVFGKSKAEEYGFISLQFLKEGVPEYRYGDGVGFSSVAEVQSLISSGQFGATGIYNDNSLGTPCIAVYSPVYGSAETDGVLVYFAVSELFNGEEELNELTKYYFFSSIDGNIIKSKISDGMKTDVSHNVFTYLYALTESKPDIDTIEQQTKSKVGGAFLIHIDGEEYVATSIPIRSLNGECFVLQLFKADQLLQGEYALYDRVLVVTVFLAVFAILALLFSIIIMRTDRKKLIKVTDIDPVLGCNTYKKFVYDATKLLEQNRFSKYAVIYFDIYKFHYFKEQLGVQEAETAIEFVSNICKQMTDINESFGHVIDDAFVMIVHYSDMTELSERIKLMGALMSKYNTSKRLGTDIKLSVGVFLVENDQRNDVQKMLDCAKIAKQANAKFTENPYTVYDSAIATSYLQEAGLEAKMRTALKNRDFKLFFQPKYNIENDRIDSAEVLVRWYDPNLGSYIAPDSFIRVFEANGFVCELDHYVFEETCRFLQHLTVEGEKVIPLAVNVSRATAIKPDFLNFYIEKKKEYGVADDFITLEFTESFAAESYDLLETLLTKLKNEGFKCAIDDFGMGNASLIAVKELSVDELKFDRALISKGKNSEKDNAILKMLINVSKELGMHVTQEGVETREDMNRLKALGCDVIQGYYYAKPMHIIDFLDFVKGDTSLAAISNQKPTRQQQPASVS